LVQRWMRLTGRGRGGEKKGKFGKLGGEKVSGTWWSQVWEEWGGGVGVGGVFRGGGAESIHKKKFPEGGGLERV